MYNLTNFTSANNILEYTQAMNQTTNGLLGMIILAVCFLLIFVGLKKVDSDTVEVLMTDCIITAVISILLWAMKLATFNMSLYPIIGFFGFAMVYHLGAR